MIEAPVDPHVCHESANPRHTGMCDCGKPYIPDDSRTRDFRLERSLTELAARAAGLTRTSNGAQVGDTLGLDDFADGRALPGGVRVDLDADREAYEELADARNYMVWGIEPIYERMLAGDSAASADYARRMRALSHIVEAWHALLVPAA